MCGIAGIVVPDAARSPDLSLLRRMADRLLHRGPDGSGEYTSARAALAHRRLAIIDLSPEGLQPMANEDGTLRLVFNGEIYNYIELREELTEKGHTFRSDSDTEVILHAYEEWGRICLNRFNGMWAFAIWDDRAATLFCARDRLGIKPFYYTEVDGEFLFASEIKALLCHPSVGKTPDEETFMAYLAWGVQDHSPKTMFSGVLQLPPAHSLVVDASGAHAPVRYWDVTVNPAVSGAGNHGEEAAHLRDLLTDAVRIHLRSDVRVGTCLSGGIDSSTLTVIINNLIRSEHPASVGQRQNTFSSCFADARFDESRYIDEIVTATGVSAHKVFPDPEQLWDDLTHLIRMQDEPFSMLSIYAQYCVMRLARDHVKVVLDGQGADEMLAGYLAYQGPYIRELFSGGHVLTALRELSGSLHYHGGFFRSAFGQLWVRKGRRRLLRGHAPDLFRYRGRLDEVLKRELVATNLPALLHYEDRNSMAFSIESRVPYLDYRLVEYLASLPLDRKIRGGVTKHILRGAIKGLVPERIRCRMDKMGFVTPEEIWMKEELRPMVLEILSSESFKSRKYWDADAVARNYLDYLAGKTAYSSDLWRILCAELWLRIFYDNRQR